MSLDKKEAAKVARLARIDMNDEDLGKIAPQLSNILGFVEQLSKVNTDNVAPLANVIDITANLREDEVNDAGYADKILSNAPKEMQDYFIVPNAIEEKK